jgi:hypothetical protein
MSDSSGKGCILTTDTSSPPRFSGRQRLILLVLLGAAFVFAADYSILNVALPRVGRSVGLGLTGTRLALAVNVAVTLASVVLIWIGLRPRGSHSDTAVASAPGSKGNAEELAAS